MQTKLQWDKNTLEAVFRELYSLENAKKPDFIGKLYGVENSTKDTESVEGIGGEGLFEEWGKSGNQVYYADINELWQKYYRHTKYSLGRQIDRDFVDDLKLTAIKDRITSMADAEYKSLQYQAVESFNNAFTTSGTDFRGRSYSSIGPDTKSLCAADHPYSPDDSTNTQSNTGTSPLSIDAWDTTATTMQGWVDDQGNIEPAMPTAILVHPYNARKAFQIAGIPGKEAPKYEPGTSDFNLNIYSGEINVIVDPFLKNKYAWFAMDESRMRRFHKWFWRRKVENGSMTDFDTEVAKFKAIGRWSHGFHHWAWVMGHNASS